MLEWPKRDSAIRVQYLSATCRLSKLGTGNPETVPFVMLGSLKALEPRQGHGTELMKQVCAAADFHGDQILLHVGRYGRRKQMTNSELIIFYQKHGFTILEDGKLPLMMGRMPNAAQ